MSEQRDRLGSSGVFKVIVESARKVKRALSEGDADLPPRAHEVGTKIAQSFVASRFADVHAMSTSNLQQATGLDRFVASWADAARDRGPFTGFEISDAGHIDLGFIPGLEEVPQSKFVAFLEIAFSSPEVALDDDNAFSIGAVLLEDGGQVRVGALHSR
jgi:hypothetical protein